MKTVLLLFFLFGLSLLGFCFWGVSTSAGQAAFPEMAGLYPFYAGGLSGAIVLLTALIYTSRRWRDRRASRSSRER